MLIVERSDGFLLNLSAGISFRFIGNDMIVEYPGEEFYRVKTFYKNELCIDGGVTYYKEFEGWPG